MDSCSYFGLAVEVASAVRITGQEEAARILCRRRSVSFKPFIATKWQHTPAF